MAFNAETEGLDYGVLQKVGLLELAYDKDDLGRRTTDLIRANMHEWGWIGRVHGSGALPDFGWNVYDRDGDGVLRLQTKADPNRLLDPREQWDDGTKSTPAILAGVDRQGKVVFLPNTQDLDLRDSVDAIITVPNDGVWRTLRVFLVRTNIAPGRVSVTTGSTTVIGTNTSFDDYVGKLDANNPTAGTPNARGMMLRIDVGDTANGNDGIYEIDTIVSPTELTLVSAPNGTTEVDVLYRIAGEFFGGVPADPDIHIQERPTWLLGPRQIGTKLTGDGIIVMDVRRSGGVTTLIDRRMSQLYRPIARGEEQSRGYVALPMGASDTFSGLAPGYPNFYGMGLRFRFGFRNTLSGISAVARSTSCLANDFQDILFFNGDLIGNIECMRSRMDWMNADAVDASTRVQVDGSGLAFNPCAIRLPAGAGATQVIVYDKSGTIKLRTSADNGLTWSGESTIWNAPLVDPLDIVAQPAIILTLDLRLLVVASYFDNATGRTSIRTILSDDLGTTWDSNANAGFVAVDDTTGGLACTNPALCQDDGGNLFTAFEHDGKVRLYRGRNAGNPKPGDADGPLAADYIGDVVSQDPAAFFFNANQNSHQPALWVAPDGSVLVFFGVNHDDGFTGTNMAVMCSTVTWVKSTARIVHSSLMRRGSANGVQDLGLRWAGSVVQDQGGVLHLWYRQSLELDSQWQPVMPIPLPKTRRMAYEPPGE